MIKKILFILPAIAILSSCIEDSNAETATKQEETIDSFLTTRYADSTVVNNKGVNRIILLAGDGDIAEVGDSVAFDYTGYIFSSGLGEQFTTGSSSARLGRGELIKGLEYGLEGMKKGENSYVLFSTRYGFYDEPTGTVPTLSPLIYDLTLTKVIKNN